MNSSRAVCNQKKRYFAFSLLRILGERCQYRCVPRRNDSTIFKWLFLCSRGVKCGWALILWNCFNWRYVRRKLKSFNFVMQCKATLCNVCRATNLPESLGSRFSKHARVYHDVFALCVGLVLSDETRELEETISWHLFYLLVLFLSIPPSVGPSHNINI